MRARSRIDGGDTRSLGGPKFRGGGSPHEEDRAENPPSLGEAEAAKSRLRPRARRDAGSARAAGGISTALGGVNLSPFTNSNGQFEVKLSLPTGLKDDQGTLISLDIQRVTMTLKD